VLGVQRDGGAQHHPGSAQEILGVAAGKVVGEGAQSKPMAPLVSRSIRRRAAVLRRVML
jgi:hypothetical protein